MSQPPDPAVRSYFFGKGYRDLLDTIKESWSRNSASARGQFERAEEWMSREGLQKGVAAFFIAAGLSIAVAGTLFFLAASLVHVTILLAFLLLIYAAFSLIYLSERAYLAAKRFFTVCPACSHRSALPVYFCPNGHAHQRLIPSSYGILWRRCLCGEKLPATFFLNRDRLAAACANPKCNHMLKIGHILSRKAFVPVFGGPSVGKSAFLFSAIHKLVSTVAPGRGLTTAFVEPRAQKEFEQVQEKLAQGQPPAKTLVALPHALTLALSSSQGGTDVLYLYDPAGETFLGTDNLGDHAYQCLMSGMVFLIDPFAIPAVREEYGDRLPAAEAALKPSALLVEDALARILVSLETRYRLGKTARVDAPVAVVVNKLDAFDLADRVAARAVTATDGVPVESLRVRDQLLEWNLGDVVQQIETRCKRVRYFACSALGRLPDGDGRAFEPVGVVEPLLWVLQASVPILGRATPPALHADG